MTIRQELNKLRVLIAATGEADGDTRDLLRSESVEQAIKVNNLLCEGPAARKVRETLETLKGASDDYSA